MHFPFVLVNIICYTVIKFKILMCLFKKLMSHFLLENVKRKKENNSNHNPVLVSGSEGILMQFKIKLANVVYSKSRKYQLDGFLPSASPSRGTTANTQLMVTQAVLRI